MIPGLQISAVCDNGGNDGNFRIRWNTYESNLTQVFEQLLLAGDFVDVSLVCPGTDDGAGSVKKSRALKAHRVILSACSPFFQRLLLEHPATECSLHPTVVIMPEEVNADDLTHVLQFIYSGELDVPRDRIEGVLRTAAHLEVKGLSLDCLEEQLSRESSLDPSSLSSTTTTATSSFNLAAYAPPLPRPSSQQSSDGHSSRKRKSSPKFRFTKQKRKSHRPTRRACEEEGTFKTLEEAEVEAEMRQDEAECDAEVERTTNTNNSAPQNDDMPVDFTINKKRNEEEDDNADKPAVVVPRRGRGRPPRLSPGQLAFLSRRQVEIFARDADGGPPTMIVGPADTTTTTTSELTLQRQQQQPQQEQQQQQMEIENADGDDNFAKVNYTKGDMTQALDALKMKKLTLTKASELYGIPPTTLWQRANRMGISTPKKETTNKSWNDEDLENALDALRKKEISANKAAKRFGIPSSTLYKIARKEKIELAQPFNAQQTSWTQEDLNRALESIRKGMPVQKAASEFGIPSGTLYGRCKKVGIELSKAAAVHWSEDDMTKALDSVKEGGMSINQAAIHHNLPYSSLYGRINRLKKDLPGEWGSFPTDFGLEALMAQHHLQSSSSSAALEEAGSALSAEHQAAAAAAVAAAFPHSLPLGLLKK